MLVGYLPLLAAPFVGSFLGVVVRRGPVGGDWVLGRSGCEMCGRRLGVLELVPLVSFLVLRGRCRGCGGVISVFHCWIEVAAVVVAGWAVLAGGVLAGGDVGWVWADCVFGWWLLALAWIDWETFRLPDGLTLPFVLVGLGATWVLDREAVGEHAVAAGLGYLAFAGVAVGYRRLRGREGLGGGDAKLLAGLGAWVGLEGLPWVVLGAAAAGILGAGAMRVRGRMVTGGTAVPFGPCLALAGWVVRLHM